MNNEKVQKAIDRLKAFEPADEPYYLCYSGGKDSDCIRILADLAGVKHDIVHNLTTVDAPETVRYIKSIPNIQIEKPKYSTPITMKAAEWLSNVTGQPQRLSILSLIGLMRTCGNFSIITVANQIHYINAE